MFFFTVTYADHVQRTYWNKDRAKLEEKRAKLMRLWNSPDSDLLNVSEIEED